MLTEEEKAELEREKAAAKCRCRETAATISQLKRILTGYHRDFYRWKQRYEEADRKLAMDEKLVVIPSPGKGVKMRTDKELIVKLSRAQIMAIAEELGVVIEVGEED